VLSATFLLHLAPGDPCRSSEPAHPARAAPHLRQLYGLDRRSARTSPGLAAALRGDWDPVRAPSPAAAVIAQAPPATLLLAAAALPSRSAWAGARRGGWDGGRVPIASSAPCLCWCTVAGLLLGLMAILLFSVRWPLFPPATATVAAGQLPPLAAALDVARHPALPPVRRCRTPAAWLSCATPAPPIAGLYRARRRHRRAPRGVALRAAQHAAAADPDPRPPAAAPLSGSLVVEVASPGRVGRLAYDAILSRDYPWSSPPRRSPASWWPAACSPIWSTRRSTPGAPG
jgi:ABC-type dipeptide/oligopeptide/nickel transport system permease component